jgi:hypothetical protein
VSFSALTNSSNNPTDIVALLQRFVEVSAVMLLRMARAKSDKHGPIDFPSIIIFLDRFVQASPLLTQDMLDACLPYAILRNMYKQIYEDKAAPGKPVTDAPSTTD